MRTTPALAAAVLAGVLLATGCGSPATPAPTAPAAATTDLVTGTFIGQTSDPDIAVAIVADPAASGGTTRALRAYLCNGLDGLNEWFPTEDVGNTASITSLTSPATLETTLTEAGATGTATLPDGRALTFTAPQASGLAGLFDVTLAGSTATGTSTTGQRIEITRGPDGRTDATVDGRPLPAAILGLVQNYAAGSSEELRLIVLADGTTIGASKGKPSNSPGFTWMDLVD